MSGIRAIVNRVLPFLQRTKPRDPQTVLVKMLGNSKFKWRTLTALSRAVAMTPEETIVLLGNLNARRGRKNSDHSVILYRL